MKNIKNLILLLFPTVNTSPPSISTHHLASFEQSVGHELSGSKSSRVSLRRERDMIYIRGSLLASVQCCNTWKAWGLSIANGRAEGKMAALVKDYIHSPFWA